MLFKNLGWYGHEQWNPDQAPITQPNCSLTSLKGLQTHRCSKAASCPGATLKRFIATKHSGGSRLTPSAFTWIRWTGETLKPSLIIVHSMLACWLDEHNQSKKIDAVTDSTSAIAFDYCFKFPFMSVRTTTSAWIKEWELIWLPRVEWLSLCTKYKRNRRYQPI